MDHVIVTREFTVGVGSLTETIGTFSGGGYCAEAEVTPTHEIIATAKAVRRFMAIPPDAWLVMY
jgi:hypothetical protein